MREGEGFTGGLSEDALRRLTEAGTRRRFERGSTLLNEGDVAGRVLLVRSGQVKIAYLTPEGKEIVLAVRGPGQLLGELSVVDGEPVSANAVALEDVEVLAIPAGTFRELLLALPELAMRLILELTGRLRDADHKRAEFGALDSVSRVARRLVELAERFGDETSDGLRINLSLSQEELAGWTGSSRESVSKALQSLRSRGLIETHRKGITVTDLEALRRRST
jgi:CRP/FNR family transcriptional regulator, cyclic AMP receptor protein